MKITLRAIMQSESLTPLMKQYFDIRSQYPDTLLFFQVGDFYELFFDENLQLLFLFNYNQV